MLNVTLHQVAEFKENATARKDVQDRLQEGKSSPKFQREAAFNSGHISTVARRDGSTAERACKSIQTRNCRPVSCCVVKAQSENVVFHVKGISHWLQHKHLRERMGWVIIRLELPQD